jgi:DNA replication protein DnaC
LSGNPPRNSSRAHCGPLAAGRADDPRGETAHTRLRAARLDLLIIDDFALKALDATTTVDFYELCVERHAKAVTINVTSNCDPDEWLSMTSDQLLAQSAFDRLTGHAHTLILEGPSYRQRHNQPLNGQ